MKNADPNPPCVEKKKKNGRLIIPTQLFFGLGIRSWTLNFVL